MAQRTVFPAALEDVTTAVSAVIPLVQTAHDSAVSTATSLAAADATTKDTATKNAAAADATTKANAARSQADTAAAQALAAAQAAATTAAANTQLTARVAALETALTALAGLPATVAQHTTDIANRLPLAGGTLTGPLNVMTATTAANPLQFSTLPLSQTVTQTLPLIALGATYSFTVAVPNAAMGQVVVVNAPLTLLAAGALFEAAVTAAGTVTIYLKAGVAIAAGAQTFILRVLR